MESKLEDSWEDGEAVHPPPLVVVLGADEGPYWCQGTPPQVNVTVWGTPSGPSTASCTNSRSPSLNSFCSDVSWGDGGNDLASLFKPRVNRSRHASTELLSCNRGLMAAAPQRLCASHDHLDTCKGKGRHRSRQDKAEMGSRERSSSNVENGHRDTTPDSRVKRFLSKMRSYSHHDLLHGRGRSGSCTDAVKAEESLVPEPEDVPEVPATAINARLVGRFRKNGPDLKKRRWSAWEDRMLRLWGSKTHGDEGHVESNTDPEPADPLPAPPPTPATLDVRTPAQAQPDKRRLARMRSNSESAIITHEKKRKRGFHPKDSRLLDILLDFHHRKKRGSLPSLVANKHHAHSAAPLQKEDPPMIRNGRALSCHNLTDFAVEDYFGENSGCVSEDELDGDRSRHALHPLDAHGHSRHSRSRFSIDNILNVLR
ncbi:hypothetical protein E2C01_086526 [Portunus trituberculatus]|uniref:Uncharacterized protein n=1 Tax=Portunus trituberculatus TaxID=210409 RepID=A0A5B7JBQ3_PORTR|nr:hypothetical protein [Portunus trituberculatus]